MSVTSGICFSGPNGNLNLGLEELLASSRSSRLSFLYYHLPVI